MINSISYLIPIFNEEENIKNVISRIKKAFSENRLENFEIIFVDDGSRDKSVEIIKNFINDGLPIKCICLSRNFGHQAALSAGMKYVSNDLIAILDGDLQDPPEVINNFLPFFEKGYSVVYGVRKKRKEIFYKRFCYSLFYKLLSYLSDIEIPLDSGDFCCMTNEVVKTLNSLPEQNRFIRGLRSYIGFNQIGVNYERDSRQAGEPKYTFRKLFKLASDGIYNFSDRPLKIATSIGFLISVSSIIVIILLIIQRIFSIKVFGYSPSDVPGYTSLIISNFFVAGIQLSALGIIGEYISRIFLESKKRPSYLVREILQKNNKITLN